MELSKQIKRYRTEMNLSQEELAEKIYVTRQSVSNWENEKNYPDIQTILRMASLFDVSLEQLIRGDLKMMKEEINTVDILKFKRYGQIYTALLLSNIIVGVPLIVYADWYGAVIFAVWFAVTLIFSIKVEKFKKQHDIQTFREIVAFCNGERLDEIAVHQEHGKRTYQKVLLALGAALCAAVVGAVMFWLRSKLMG